MLARFFTIMQRNWTYEIDYTLEIFRMIFINVVTIGIPFIVRQIPNAPHWVFLVFGFAFAYIFWGFYFRFSIGRMIQIKTNRKYSIEITKNQLIEIMKEYPNQSLYCKVNGKYKQIKTIEDISDGDVILLITIGKKQLIGLKKLKKIIDRQK